MSISHGTKYTPEYANDFNPSRDEKGRWTGRESFSINESALFAYIPPLHAPCHRTGWEFLQVSGVDVEPARAGNVKVNLQYGGFDEGDPWSFDDSPIGRYTYDMGITTSEEPLETHYRYRNTDKGGTIPKYEKELIIDIKLGRYKRVADDDYTFEDSEGNTEVVLTELGKELVDKILSGIETYLKAEQVWRASVVSRSMPDGATINKVGKINPAKNAPTVSEGRNWLFAGCNSSQVINGDKAYWNITFEWILSGLGGWDEDIYD